MVTTENNLKTEDACCVSLVVHLSSLGCFPSSFYLQLHTFQSCDQNIPIVHPRFIKQLQLYSRGNPLSHTTALRHLAPFGVWVIAFFPSLSCFLGVPSQKSAFRKWTCEHLRGLFKFCCFLMSSLALEGLVAVEMCTAVLLLFPHALPTHGGCGPNRRLLGSCWFTKVRVV